MVEAGDVGQVSLPARAMGGLYAFGHVCCAVRVRPGMAVEVVVVDRGRAGGVVSSNGGWQPNFVASGARNGGASLQL